uniref:Uncharacterized protein n=1 Tax=Fundulus heteroclitus TaxID=8078 RepID=A0A3Q2P7T5_FUNHE
MICDLLPQQSSAGLKHLRKARLNDTQQIYQIGSCNYLTMLFHGLIRIFKIMKNKVVRNRTCARCAVKDSARAPTSSPTAESTAATGLSAAPAVSTLSSAEWTCSATKRLSVAMENTYEHMANNGTLEDTFMYPKLRPGYRSLNAVV